MGWFPSPPTVSLYYFHCRAAPCLLQGALYSIVSRMGGFPSAPTVSLLNPMSGCPLPPARRPIFYCLPNGRVSFRPYCLSLLNPMSGCPLPPARRPIFFCLPHGLVSFPPYCLSLLFPLSGCPLPPARRPIFYRLPNGRVSFRLYCLSTKSNVGLPLASCKAPYILSSAG